MEPMVNIALRAAREAGGILVRAFDNLSQNQRDPQKGDDYLARVSQNVQFAIEKNLKKAYPEYPVYWANQELPSDLAESYWLINSLSGGNNFLYGFSQFAISLSFEKKGRTEHALIVAPLLQEEFSASRGRGAKRNDKRIRVSSQKNLAGALLATNTLKTNESLPIDTAASLVAQIALQEANLRHFGCDALSLAYTACGRIDGSWSAAMNPADLNAGALLITESGGLIGDFQGGFAYQQKNQLLAANPKRFKALLQIIQPAQKKT